MEKMTIYLSLPITGQEDTWLEREAKLRELAKAKFPEAEIIAPSDINPKGCGKTYARMMGDCIEALLRPETTHILMAEGWDKSKGCNLEWRAAIMFRKRIMSEAFGEIFVQQERRNK